LKSRKRKNELKICGGRKVLMGLGVDAWPTPAITENGLTLTNKAECHLSNHNKLGGRRGRYPGKR